MYSVEWWQRLGAVGARKQEPRDNRSVGSDNVLFTGRQGIQTVI